MILRKQSISGASDFGARKRALKAGCDAKKRVDRRVPRAEAPKGKEENVSVETESFQFIAGVSSRNWVRDSGVSHHYTDDAKIYIVSMKLHRA